MDGSIHDSCNKLDLYRSVAPRSWSLYHLPQHLSSPTEIVGDIRMRSAQPPGSQSPDSVVIYGLVNQTKIFQQAAGLG